MPLLRRIGSLALAFTVIGATAAHHAPDAAASPAGSRTEAADREVRRIRAHFDSVLTELAQRDVRSLGAVQATNRSSLMVTLAKYRDQGVFPNNYDFPGQAVPYFVDRKTGTRCAVAHLLESTGRGDIVQRVAHANNNILVDDLAGDAELAAWLNANGLTLAEAARIQVPYVQETPSTAKIAANVSVGLAMPIAFVASVGSSAWNARSNSDGHSKFGNVMGITAGAATIASGMMVVSNTRYDEVGYVAAGIGAMSIALATRSTIHRRQIAAREAEQKRGVAEVSIAPIVPTANSGAGLSVSIRF